jgi:hypothetical protein
VIGRLFNALILFPLAISACTPTKPSDFEQAFDAAMKGVKADIDRAADHGQRLAFQCYYYRHKTGRWPVNLVDLKSVAGAYNGEDPALQAQLSQFNPDKYKDSLFTPLPNGNLRVQCTLTGTVAGTMTMTLSPEDHPPRSLPAGEKNADAAVVQKTSESAEISN